MISAALRQDYRTLSYKLLRHPLGATLFVAVASTPIYLYTTFFATNGALSARLDYAFTQSWNMVIVNGMELIIAGALLELFLVNRTKLWIQFKTLNPSPSESGLQSRMLYNTLPLMLVLLIALAVQTGTWLEMPHAKWCAISWTPRQTPLLKICRIFLKPVRA